MAKKSYDVKVYDVLDENGNPTGDVLRYPVNPATGKTYVDAEEGSDAYVYKTNDPTKEVYESSRDAKATTSIDPVSGKITVTGPKWLTSQIVNSETFKNNFSENGALLSAVNLYRQNPNAKVETTSGETMTVADAIGQYADMASAYGESAAKIIDYRRTKQDQFGATLSDEDVAVATSYVNKEDMKGNEAIYVPDWALKRFDWEKLGSWDPENKTVSASDFFESIYQLSLRNRGVEEFQEEALKQIADALDRNVYDHDDEELSQKKAEELGSKEYASELARSLQMYSLVSGNKPETTALYNAHMFWASTCNSALAAAHNSGTNFSEAIAKSNETIARWLSFGNENARVAIQNYWNFLGPGSTTQLTAFFSGEILNAIGDFNSDKEFNEVIDGFMSDYYSLIEGQYGEAIEQHHAELTALKEDLSARRGAITGWWAAGDFVGYMAYKVAENIVLLNAGGAAAGDAMASALNSTGFAKFAAKTLSPRAANALVAGMSKITNVTAQAITETLLDDRQLVNKAIESGKFTGELWNKFLENEIGNAMGEIAMPLFGKGTKKAGNWWVKNTTVGKYAYLATHKLVNGATAIKYGATGRFFAILNKVKGATPEGLAKAIMDNTLTPDKRLALFNVGLQFARRDIARTIAKMPIFGEIDEALEGVTNASYGFVFGGKAFLEASTAEEAEAAVKAGVENSATEAEAAVAKGMEDANNAPRTAFGKKLDERATKNYEAMRKQVLMRANLENQIDSITKGTVLQGKKMMKYAGKEWSDFSDATNKAAEQEVIAKSNGVKIEYWEEGTILSKQSSEYLSLKTQLGRYDWKLSKVADAGGFWKDALYDDGETRIFKSKKEFDELAEYAEVQRVNLARLEKMLGKDLCESLDEAHVAAGRLHTKIMHYMGRHGYIDEEEYKKFMRLANNQGWGKNGEYYLPTTRLIGEDANIGFKKGDAWLSSDNKPMRKMVSSGLNELNPGSEDPFGDPISNLIAWMNTQAKIAQAQDWGRALHAVSAPLRKAKGYDMNGLSKYDAGIMEKTVADTKKYFENAFSGLSNYSVYKDVLPDVMNANIFKEAIGGVRGTSNTYNTKQLASKKAQQKEVGSRVNKALFGTGSSGLQTDLVNEASDADISALINSTSEGKKFIFNPTRGLVSAESFQGWYDSLPKSSQKMITEKLAGQKLNLTNVRNLIREDGELVSNIKRDYVNSVLRKEGSFKKSAEYKNFIKQQYEESIRMMSKTVLSDDIKKFKKLSQDIAKYEGKVAEEASEAASNEFVALMDKARQDLIKELGERMMVEKDAARTYKALIKRFVDAGIKKDLATRYIVLDQLTKKEATELAAPLLSTSGKGEQVAFALSAKAKGKAMATKYYREAANLVGSTLKERIDLEWASVHKAVSLKVPSDLLDNETYFSMIQKQMNDIEKTYLFKAGQEISPQLNLAQRRKIVELIGPDGKFAYYETDPLYAVLTNEPIGSYAAQSGVLGKVNNTINRIFRFGTTGIDNKSFVNQWFRDPGSAMTIGSYYPFMDLSSGGIISKFASAYRDLGLPFGTKVFGKFATQKITDEVVELTYEATKNGLIEEFGQDWFDGFTKEMVGDLTGEEAEQTLKRATVQFAVGDVGYGRLPGLGGVTREEFFRGTSKGELEKIEPFQVSKERSAIVYGDAKAYKEAQSRLHDFFSKVSEDISRGSFREQFMRQGVYTSQYRLAISSGMTRAEADVWATRYALDATTNFNRTFMFGNKFIKSVPYLGAAINGSKSFWRLFEMDPIGITKRFVFGLALPYARMLSASLSDEENRKAYMNLREYEKSDSAAFVWHGQVIMIPVPQELAAFLAPFRHVVEKAADVQDNTWFDLVLSDTLGIMPLDLSGFVNLDKNYMVNEGEEGIGSRIQRGLEKATSSLMSPQVKAMYMMTFGRDPYTGREIDTSYVRADEEGNLEIVDSSQSDIANWLHETFPNVSATGAEKVLKTLFGRSTITILEGAKDILSGNFSNVLGQAAGEFMSPLEGAKYDKARSDWQNAIKEAYARKESLINNDMFKKAFQVMTDKNYSDEKRNEAKRQYNELLDEYSKFVLDIAKTMKAKYPDQYTDVRAAQMISLLTLDQGTAYLDTAQAAEIRQEAYFSARNLAINTFLKMGFPADTTGNTLLGTGYYDKYGQYQFKVFTPYQIEALNSTVYGTNERVQAEIKAAIKAADVDKSEMWSGYYAASSKAERKAYKDKWNTQMVHVLYPVVSKYGVETVLNSGDTVDVLDNYIFVDNPYQTKQYLKKIFGGEE